MVSDERMARTRAALAVWDADRPDRDARWRAAGSDTDFAALIASDEAEADKVREAFAEDTKHVNSRERAFLIHPDHKYLRAWVAR